MKKMNKFIAGLAIAGLAFGLTACGDDSSSSAPDDKTTSSADKYLHSFMMDNSQFVGTAALSDDQSEVVKDFIEAGIK